MGFFTSFLEYNKIHIKLRRENRLEMLSARIIRNIYSPSSLMQNGLMIKVP